MTMEGPPSTRSFRPWVWDKPGSVMNFENFESISEEPGSATTTRPPTSRTRGFTTSSGRQTVRWPFHSFSNSRSSIPNYPRRPSNSRSIPHSSGSFPRRAAGSISRSVSSVLGSDIIPDYVVNFMRGETPETLARRHRIPDSPEPGQFQRPRESQLDFIHSASSTPDNSRPGTPRAEREKMLVEERPQPTRSLMTGWRAGVAANMFLAFLILVASVACLALASAQGHMSTWESLLMEGNSTTVEGITRGILAAVNVFAIILIAGANYVVQILNSPTRAEVDNAHSTFKWLDIGTPSLRNMPLISSTRATLSGIMMVFALLSQVIYNSIIITTEHAEKSKSSLNVNGPLLAAITLINVVLILTYAIAVALALTRQVFSPLVTLGDALSSFLADPDVSTQDSCLITKEEIKKGLWGDREGKYWYAKTSRWFNVPSFNRWAIWFMTWIMPVGLAAAALTLGAVKEPKEAFTRFGKATVVYELSAGTSRSGMAVVAALPQLLLGLLYLSSNALLTLFYLSHELSQFTSDLLPLRVSSGQPLGSQTTSLYLTLPRPVSWILFFLVVAMAFLLSQGILLVTVDDIKGTTTGIGFSPLPLLILLVLLVLLGLGIAGLALRQVDPRGSVEGGEPAGNPLALVGGTCSAVLSARCHRVSREGGVETLEVRWGVVREGVGMNAGHATFSGRPVGDIMVGRAYS